jgi:hypothetical protein
MELLLPNSSALIAMRRVRQQQEKKGYFIENLPLLRRGIYGYRKGGESYTVC